MAQWDDKYIVTEPKKNIVEASWTPQFSKEEAMRLLSLDSEIIKGAFYMETAWYWPGKWPEGKGDEGTVMAHTHEWDEVVAYIGTNPDDPYDLGGEVEFWIDGKQNNIDKSFITFIPAGIEHCPLSIRRVDRPIFHFTAGMGKSYI